MTRQDFRATLAIFALAASIYLLIGHWVPEEPDSEVAFQATRAEADGRLHLEADTPSARRILGKVYPDGNAYNCRVGPDGKQYPYWGVYYTASGVPLYALGVLVDGAARDVNERFAAQTFTSEGLQGSQYFARAFVLMLGALTGAGTLALIYVAARRADASPAAAAIAALLTGFATSFGVQARSGLVDSHVTFLMALALERALAARRSDRAFDIVTAGVAGSLAFGCTLRVAFALPGVGLLLLAPRHFRTGLREPLRAAVLFVAGAAPGILGVLAANFLRWGNPLAFGYEKATESSAAWVPMHQGLWRILAAPSKGVVEYALPLLLLGLIGWARLALRGERLLALALAATAFGSLVVASFYYDWHGSFSFGPRYACPTFPMLAIGAAVTIDALRGPARAAAIALGIAGFLVIAPGLVTSPFAAIANAMAGAKFAWPDSDFPPGAPEIDKGAERFQCLCVETGPLNFLRVQHRMLWAALAGREKLRLREDLGIDHDGDAETPAVVEHRGFGGIGWVGFRTRFGSEGVFVVPAVLVTVAIVSIVALARALRPPKRGFYG